MSKKLMTWEGWQRNRWQRKDGKAIEEAERMTMQLLACDGTDGKAIDWQEGQQSY